MVAEVAVVAAAAVAAVAVAAVAATPISASTVVAAEVLVVGTEVAAASAVPPRAATEAAALAAVLPLPRAVAASAAVVVATAAATVVAAAMATPAALGASRGGKLSHHPSIGAVPWGVRWYFWAGLFLFPCLGVILDTSLSTSVFTFGFFGGEHDPLDPAGVGRIGLQYGHRALTIDRFGLFKVHDPTRTT